MPRSSRSRPVIGLACSMKTVNGDEGLLFHAVPDTYVAAVSAHGALPLLVPALGEELDLDLLLSMIDGLVLTGAIANVHPDCYAGTCRPCPPYDHRRDRTTLRLIPEILARDMPLLAVCRGIQELNVALGGTLYARVHEVEGRFDHRSNYNDPVRVQFAPAHPVILADGGRLRALADGASIVVNSLHGQGIDRLAPGLAVEATALDGQIEAVRVEGKRFAIGVQWHPEWDQTGNPFSRALFSAFVQAVAARAEANTHG